MSSYLKSIYSNITSSWTNKALFVLIVGTVITGGFLYWRTEKRVEETIINLTLYKQSLLVKAEARSIKEFFRSRETELLFLTTLSSTQENSNFLEQIQIAIGNAKEKAPNTISDIAWIDNEGDVVFRASKIPGDNNVSDREYFKWLKDPINNHKVYYTDILDTRAGVEKGKKIILLVSPVWKGNEFLGAIGMVVSLEKLGNPIPKEDALEIIDPFHKNIFLMYAFIIYTIIMFSFLLILATKSSKRDAYLEGFSDGRDKEADKENKLQS